MRENLGWIAGCSFPTLCVVLDNYYRDILPQYIANSSDKPIFFSAIAQQFVDSVTAAEYQNIWTECVEGTMSRPDQDFANATFNVTGTLLALSFFMLSSLKVGERKDGFRVLFNVALATVLLRDPHAEVGVLIEKLIRLKSLVAAQHPELAENLLIGISKILHKELVFCGEQFLDKAFRLCKSCGPGSIFISIITPWLSGMMFNKEDAGVMIGAEPRFVVFSTFSFISLLVENAISIPLNRSHVLIIDHVLDQQSADKETPALLTFVLCLFRLQQKSKENAKKCISILTYCLTRQPKFIVEHIATYLSFRSWFYHQIQLSRIDLAFDMDRFMAEITGSEGESSGRKATKGDDDAQDSVALYDVVVKFSLRCFRAFLKENRTSLNSVLPTVILFCLVNFGISPDGKAAKLLKELCEDDSSDGSGPVHSFSSSVQPVQGAGVGGVQGMLEDVTELGQLCGAPLPAVVSAIQFVLQMSKRAVQSMCDEALRWSLACGEVQLSARAAKLYEIFMNSSDDDTVSIIIRTIYIMNSILNERTAPDFKEASSFLYVLVENTKIDFKLSIQYLTVLLTILTKSQQYLKRPSEEAFWLCCSFINIQDSQQMAIGCAALRFILEAVKNKSFLKRIAKAPDVNFQGFLCPILQMQHTTESLKLSYDLVTLLAVGNVELLTRTSGEGELLLLTLLPYLFAHQHDPELERVLQSIIKLTSDTVIKEHLVKKAGSADDFVYPIMSRLVKTFKDSHALGRVIGFYANVVKAAPEMLAPVLSICTAILQTKTVSIGLECFCEIGFSAIHDKEPSRNSLSLNFLSSLNSRQGWVQQYSLSQKMKQLPKILLHTPIDVTGWLPVEGKDPFGCIGDLPPLSIIDMEYLGCPFQRPISVAVQLVQVQPLTSWTRAMFRAEAFTIQFVDESEISPVKVSRDYTVMLKLFEKAVKGEIARPSDGDEVGGEGGPGEAKEGRKSKKVQESDQSREVKKRADQPEKTGEKRAERIAEEEKQAEEDNDFQTGDGEDAKPGGLEFLTVASSDFLPPKNEIEIAGADLLAGFKIHPLFPTTLR
jgi:hypothetical protein